MKKTFLSAGFVMMFGLSASAMTNSQVNDTIVNDTVVTQETLMMQSLALVEDTLTEDSVILESLALAEDTLTEDSVIIESLALAEDTVTRDTVIQEPVEQTEIMLAYAMPQAVALPGTNGLVAVDYKAIEVDALPQEIKDVIARDFLGATVKEAYVEETPEVTYKVILVDQAEKETTVVFDKTGKVKA